MGQKQSTPTPPAAAQATVDSVVSTNKSQSNAAVKHNEEERPHNFGQPTRPPHKQLNEAEQKNENSGASKLKTDCRVQQRASLRCIEENYENKDQACAEYFEAYKKCRREEHQRKLDENAKLSGGGGGFFG